MLRPTIRVLVVLLLCAHGVHAAPAVFHDETFADGDWTLVFYSFRSGGGAYPGGSVAAFQNGDGHPAPSRRVEDSVPVAPSPTEYATVFGAHFRAGATYDPSTQGAIASIDYSEDSILLTGGGDGQATGVALRQGGKIYLSGRSVVTPEKTWTHKALKGERASNFVLLTADGLNQSAHPDFTAGGTAIELGFYRGNSNGNGGGMYTIAGAIDNWRVRVNPFCTTAAECDDGDGCTADACEAGACVGPDRTCDDGDACTTDACTAGACTFVPVDCDDGNDCTRDGCAAGGCTYTPAADFALVEAKVTQLIALLEGPSCGNQTLSKKVVRKLRAKLAKARAKVTRADDATKAALVAKLVGKADGFLVAAGAALDAAATRGLVSGPCLSTLRGFLEELRRCVAGLPRS